jgi:HEAT repeat protein
MTAMGLPDPDRTIEGFLGDPHEGLRRAAVGYLLSRGEQSVEFARRWLNGEDAALREDVLASIVDVPTVARRVLSWDWIDARLKSGAREDLLLAARALGAMEGPEVTRRLAPLVTSPDVEVQRAAIRSAARQPSRELLPVLLPLLTNSEVSYEASDAIGAAGDAAVPELERLLSGDAGAEAQKRAARALARIGSPRAMDALRTLVRGGDVRLRHLALGGLARARRHAGVPVLPRSTVHRLFLRELRDYRTSMAPVEELKKSDVPVVRLLGESYRESADRALERALTALACWYDAKPLPGVFDRLKSGDLAVASPALEYLGHILPRAVFSPVSRIFEKEAMDAHPQAPDADRLDGWIRLGWESGDAWLRACAVRASRHAPLFDRGRFENGDGGDPMVRAELDALSGGSGPATSERAC